MNLADNKYGSLAANYVAFEIDLWVNSGANAGAYRAWCREYVDAVMLGPHKFWPWYRLQRTRALSNDFVWGIAFPHEVFPALQTDEFADFYEVFEF